MRDEGTRRFPRRAIDNPDAYVRTVLLRTYLAGRARRWTGEVPIGVLPDAATTTPDADLRLELLRALGTLPRQQRAVVVLRYFDDQTEAQAASLLGCSVGTVKTHAARALATLRAVPALQSLRILQETP